jgi:hypothetical protein
MFLKARITPAGDGFYDTRYILIKNRAILNVGTGAAYLRGTSLFWTIANAGADANAMWTSEDYLVLDRNTLVGQAKSIGHDKNFSDGSLDTQYTSGPMTLAPVACAAIWR